MYSSGQFARMFQVSKKTLRYYADIGLLKPATVDAQSGYFYYDEAQRVRMALILYLRRLRLSLDEIGALLDRPIVAWPGAVRAHHVRVRAEQRTLERVDNELSALIRRLSEGKEILDHMDKKMEFTTNVFELTKPVWVVGRAARVVHGSPEHMPTIEALIEAFFGDDAPSLIPNVALPGRGFGICAEFTPEDNSFTYMMGRQVSVPEGMEPTIPVGMRSFLIPAGHYAATTFSAPDTETITGPALGQGYDALFSWIGASEWEAAQHGVAFELYDDERFEVPAWPEMELWAPVKKKA